MSSPPQAEPSESLVAARDALVPEGAWLLEESRGMERSLRVAMSQAGLDRVRHVGETETTAVFEIRRS